MKKLLSGFFLKIFNRSAAPVILQQAVSVDGPFDSALRDQVTGLYNRKHLLQRLEANMARCHRAKERMAVILWDIDGFVDFNNRFGQEEGDKFLRKVTESIKRSIRSYDEAFRLGADEFCSILIPADEAIAGDVTSRVANSVSKDLFQGDAEYANRQFSISSGLVFFPGQSHLPEAILHEARQALYRGRLTHKTTI